MDSASSSAPQQQLIILAGVVGSGKSTFSKALVQQLPVSGGLSERGGPALTPRTDTELDKSQSR